jgi:microcystin-dependent protein
MPSHTHTATSASTAKCKGVAGNSNDAVGNFWADDAGVSSATYHPGPSDADMAAGAVDTNTTIANTGAGGAHDNVQPFQCVNFIIAVQGIFPSRN